MTYAEAVEHLYGLAPELAPSPGQSPRRFDLESMRTLCAELGNPQASFPAVLIAGTNGKGSTAATLASILTAAGYRTGLYTSPHLIRVNERIQSGHPLLPTEYGSAGVHAADGQLSLQPISDADFARLYTEVDEAGKRLFASTRLPALPSFFERLTAVAFLHFAGSAVTPRVEIAVLEVGLGGRLDATNVVEPMLSIITDIALDHQEYLGETIALIAKEKCGILRQGGTLVTLSQLPEANQAIGEAAAALNVHGVNAADFLPPALRNAERDSISSSPMSSPGNHYKVRVPDSQWPEILQVDSPLSGVHQQRNIALALAAAQWLGQSGQFQVRREALEQGVRETRWPGRQEWIAGRLLLDVAHNPAGAWTLRAALAALPEERPRTLIFSCLRDKDLAEMSRILFPLFDSSQDGDPRRRRDHIFVAPIQSPRATGVEELLNAAAALAIPVHAAPHLSAALTQAQHLTPEDGLIVVTGSVYLVGEVRQMLLERKLQHD